MLPSVDEGGTAGPFGDGRIIPPQPVYAAANGFISQLAVANVTSSLSGASTTYEEFDLRLEVCDGIQIRYGHIGPLSPRLQQLLDNAPGGRCNAYATGDFAVERCEYTPYWTVESGELIAYTSGQAAAFDFGATIPGETLSPTENSPPTYSCPLDLYDDALRNQFEQLIGDSITRRTTEPVCGNLDVDVAGSAEGRWFNDLNGTPQEDQNVALVYDNVHTEIPVISIGSSVPGVASAAYRFTPLISGQVNRDFDAITPGAGVFCFDNLSDRFGRQFPGLTILVELVNDTTLRIEKSPASSCGSGPWPITSAAAVFSR